MQRARIVETIDVPIESAWKAIDDFGNIADFHPLVTSSETLTDLPTGEGAERICRFENGSAIKERITHYRPGHGYSVTIFDTGSLPLREAFGHLYLSSTDDGRTEVDFSLEFEPKFGLFGRVLGATAMKPQFRRLLRRVVGGLERHASSPQGLPPLAPSRRSASAARAS